MEHRVVQLEVNLQDLRLFIQHQAHRLTRLIQHKVLEAQHTIQVEMLRLVNL